MMYAYTQRVQLCLENSEVFVESLAKAVKNLCHNFTTHFATIKSNECEKSQYICTLWQESGGGASMGCANAKIGNLQSKTKKCMAFKKQGENRPMVCYK